MGDADGDGDNGQRMYIHPDMGFGPEGGVHVGGGVNYGHPGYPGHPGHPGHPGYPGYAGPVEPGFGGNVIVDDGYGGGVNVVDGGGVYFSDGGVNVVDGDGGGVNVAEGYGGYGAPMGRSAAAEPEGEPEEEAEK